MAGSETSSWTCSKCGMSGACRPGDEDMCLRAHEAMVHRDED